MADQTHEQMILYSFVASQWAGVAHLALAEKGFSKSEYNIKEIDLISAENLKPNYIVINPNGTIPSLVVPSLSKALTENTDILEYLDSLRSTGPHLIPHDTSMKRLVDQLITLVHSDRLTTNLILLHARNPSEMEGRKLSIWKQFIENRQSVLEEYSTELPSHPFYGPKLKENEELYKLYTTETGPDHQEFFQLTNKMYIEFAAGLKDLDDLLVLPYAAGQEITAADLHVIPWVAHALWGAGAEGFEDWEALEELVGKSVEGFQVGEKIKRWWKTVGERDTFKSVYPELH